MLGRVVRRGEVDVGRVIAGLLPERQSPSRFLRAARRQHGFGDRRDAPAVHLSASAEIAPQVLDALRQCVRVSQSMSSSASREGRSILAWACIDYAHSRRKRADR